MLLKRCAALLVAVTLAISAAAQHAVRPERLPQDTGAAGLDQALKKLKTTARLLHTTAHPDDEDGGMLTYQARGRGVETMLMTLTRGDGGQNRTGSNLFDELGVLRTLELLESDRYYGVKQTFSRVADFGYSKTPDEARQKWGDVALQDLVRVIRTFRPDVIAAGWSGTPRDGHGHHQYSGLATIEAFHAAADPTRFPELGLPPWQAKKLYYRTRGGDYTVRFDAGQVDPNLGMSYQQFGIIGYSHQKSQNAEVFTPPAGANWRNYKLRESALTNKPAEAQTENDFFDGIDTTLPGLANRFNAPELRSDLERIDQKVNEAIATRKLQPVLDGWKLLHAVMEKVGTTGQPNDDNRHVMLALETKDEQFEEAAWLASELEVTTERLTGGPALTPGATADFRITLTNRGSDALAIESVEAWPALEIKLDDEPVRLTGQRRLPPGSTAVFTKRFSIPVEGFSFFTKAHWYRTDSERQAVHTIHSGQDPTAALPWVSPTVIIAVGLAPDDDRAVLRKVITTPFRGKPTQLAVLPRFSVLFQKATRLLPVNGNAFDASVIVRNQQGQQAAVEAKIVPPIGWSTEPASQTVHARGGEEKVVRFRVTPAAVSPGQLQLKAEVRHGRQIYTEGFSVVTREDIDTFYYYQPAIQKVSVVDVKLPAKLKVGYVMGAGDDILTALQQLGLDVTLVTPEELASGDLGKYGTIVVGIRAYDAREDVRKHNARLLAYVENGGTLIVQNNQQAGDFNQGNYPPYPLQLSRERVADESAPVTILKPDDPVFSYPNTITARDFDGWVQERGVNFANSFDDKYESLIAAQDPGEHPHRGGMLRARYGKGTYIYTGYAFFRQLPAGVPGAIRLFVNLISAGHARN